MEPNMEIAERFEFCLAGGDFMFTVEEIYPIGHASIGLEGWFDPGNGDLLSSLHMAFARYFMAIRVNVNLGTEDQGYYRFSARMTLKPQ